MGLSEALDTESFKQMESILLAIINPSAKVSSQLESLDYRKICYSLRFQSDQKRKKSERLWSRKALYVFIPGGLLIGAKKIFS